MYTLKQLPEDFVVKEISTIQPKAKGKYLYFRLAKKNRNTVEVIQELARILGIKEKQIGFAGSKDKHAVTEQVCSIVGVGKEQLQKIRIPQVEISFLGYGDTPISLGDLESNYFEIVLRNLDSIKINYLTHIPNYFAEQRFGSNNVQIGKYLLKKQFKEAAQCIDNLSCQQHLEQYPHDAIGALKKLPLRLLRMYLNSYQSYLWNETLAQYLRTKGTIVGEQKCALGTLVFTQEIFSALEIPLIGFDTSVSTDYEVLAIIVELMNHEKITHDNFIIKPIPELSLEGTSRKAFVEVKEMKIGPFEQDELNPGKKKVMVSFTLPKGSYATMVIRHLFHYLLI